MQYYLTDRVPLSSSQPIRLEGAAFLNFTAANHKGVINITVMVHVDQMEGSKFQSLLSLIWM